MPLEEYVLRAVAAEMPGNYETEALKAQAVAARTYALKKQLTGGCAEHPGCDVCDSPSHCQAFASDAVMKDKWGPLYAVIRRRLAGAVSETGGEVLLFDGQPIDALYHAASQRCTENSGEAFMAQLPYLISVETPETCQSEVTVPFARAALLTGQNAVSGASVTERTAAGRVKTLVIGQKTYTGAQARALFSLKSTDFSVDVQKDSLHFTVFGYGHGVGMSQYGANAYAGDGWRYTQILAHYYPGTLLVRNN